MDVSVIWEYKGLILGIAWIDQTDSRSSKKKEYNQKYKINKKLKAEDKGGRSETDTNVD